MTPNHRLRVAWGSIATRSLSSPRGGRTSWQPDEHRPQKQVTTGQPDQKNKTGSLSVAFTSASRGRWSGSLFRAAHVAIYGYIPLQGVFLPERRLLFICLFSCSGCRAGKWSSWPTLNLVRGRASTPTSVSIRSSTFRVWNDNEWKCSSNLLSF